MRPAACALLAAALVTPARADDRASDRVVGKAEIIAPRPPEEGGKAPLELESLVPIAQTNLVVSTHRSQEHWGEIAIWSKVPGGYRRVATFPEDPGMGSYAPVRHFRYDGRLFLVLSFAPDVASRYTPDEVFALDQYEGMVPTLTKVDIQSPIDWFHARLGADESAQGFLLALYDDRLEWSFPVWGPRDAHCCPKAGQVHGTFDICEEKHHDDATNRWTSTWRMVVRDGTREPVRRPPTPVQTGHILPMCPAVAAGALLPDASGELRRP